MSDVSNKTELKWYEGISSYQWMVLLIASLGWVFDVFEGQIFVASMRDAMPALLNVAPEDASVSSWNNIAFGFFLFGGAVGGVLFGILSDRIGRSKTMIITILFYSLFTCASSFSQAPWQMVALRFLVAMGVGGEWAVAAAMVAEVMPTRSRSVMGSIFHASSVFGTLLAAATVATLIGNESINAWFLDRGWEAWRVGFAIGVLPALLTLLIRWKLREPDSWKAAKEQSAQDPNQKMGQLSELFRSENLRATIVGVSLSTVGLVTFWGIHIYGKNALLRRAQADALVAAELIPPGEQATAEEKTTYDVQKKAVLNGPAAATIKRAEMMSMVLNTIGGGLGLVLFGWISDRIGRKGAFVLYHVAAFAVVILLFQILLPSNASATALAVCLPVFGFFTLGMHAGYAVYFPELYPTRVRGTGTGFCFNFGRLGTGIAFVSFGILYKMTPESQALLLAPLYLLGAVIVLFGRETRGVELQQ